MIRGIFRIGEDITIGLEAVGGDIDIVVSVEAFLARSNHATQFRLDRKFDPIPMTVTAREASGDIGAGWNITLAADQTQDLRPGIYGVDAKFEVAGGAVDITERTAVLWLTESAIP